MQQKREKARVNHELKEATAKLSRARKAQREAEAVVTAMEAAKAYSLEMLGKGNKNGGNQQHQKARLEVLQRVRRAAELSPEQTSQWEFQNYLGSRDGSGPWGELGGALCTTCPTSGQRPDRGTAQRAVCVHAQRN